MRDNLLLAGSLGLLCISITYIFFFILNKSKNLKVDLIKENVRRYEKIVQKQLDNILSKNEKSKKMASVISKMLKESRIRPLGIEINLALFLLISIAVSVAIYIFAHNVLHNVLAALLLAGLAIIGPYEALKFEVSRKRRMLRRRLPNFFLVLCQLLEVTSDIIEVLEDAIPKIHNPLKSGFKAFLKNYRAGRMTLEECIDDLKERFDNDIIIRFADDIRDNLEHGGDFCSTITAYIEEAYDNERNYTERITENSGNITGVLVVLFMFLYVIDLLRKSRPDFIEILLYNPGGQLAVDFIIILFIICIGVLKYAVSFKDQ